MVRAISLSINTGQVGGRSVWQIVMYGIRRLRSIVSLCPQRDTALGT